MATAKDKIEAVLKEVKNLTVGQLRMTEKVDDIHKRSVDNTKTSKEISDELKDLRSRLEALEALSKPPIQDLTRIDTTTQEADGGTQLPHHSLTKGENQLSKLSKFHDDIPESSTRRQDFQTNHVHTREPKLPKLDFPKFTGENPRVWREKCEKYFSMYNILVGLWVSFATINFKSNAKLWLQTYEAHHTIESWPDLCVAVEHKFGRDLYQNHMRDLLQIKQTTTVEEYAERFSQAQHRVLVHNKDMGDVFFVQKFLDGLNYNISSAITLHKPRIVDGALSLVLMQEDLLELEAKNKQFVPKSGGNKFYARPSSSVQMGQQQTTSNGLLGSSPQGNKTSGKPKWDDKVAALRSARRAKGLCMKCGEPYSPQHKCPKQVSLQALEELWELAQISNSEEDTSSAKLDTDSKEEILAISEFATEGTLGKKTIRLQGLLQKQEVLILIDSSNSGTFISEELVQTLKMQTSVVSPIQVKMANGTKLSCGRTAQINLV
ncbi:unnamed protein product [Urochloa humidicola]